MSDLDPDLAQRAFVAGAHAESLGLDTISSFRTWWDMVRANEPRRFVVIEETKYEVWTTDFDDEAKARAHYAQRRQSGDVRHIKLCSVIAEETAAQVSVNDAEDQ